MEAGSLLGFGFDVTDVDNAYRAMGWNWTEIRNDILNSSDKKM
jgi:hypothetical protein